MCSHWANYYLFLLYMNFKFENIGLVEFNGDLYHCNPRKWKADDYNKTIRMFAKDKWEKDRYRTFKLEKLGYQVIVVWEEDWNNTQSEVKLKLFKIIQDEISKQKENKKTNLL